MKLVKAIIFFFAGAILAPGLCRAAPVSSSLQEKMRYERALEEKGDEILLKVLGPNQARVTVEATLKIEETPGLAKRGDEAQTRFSWLNAAQKKDKMKELLPGFTSAMPVAPMDEEERQSYSYKVSKLSVNIIAGGELTPLQINSVTDLVERVLGLDMNRGDTVELVHTQFAPAWKTIVYSPEYLGILVRYGIVGLVIIISFLIIGLGIMKLAGAMGQVAKSQEHEVSIGFGGEGGGGGQPELPGPEAGEKDKKEAGEAPAAVESSRLVFNVRREQIPLLAGMLKKEDPENISLVVYHLPDEIRGELLSSLGKDLASKVILNLATVRFIDREMIEEIKQELEKRLDSAVGGLEKAVELIAPMRYSDKKDIVRQFDTYDPKLAAEIRSVFIFDEDLLSLSEKDLGVVATSIPVAQWAEVFPGMPAALQGKIKKQLSEKSVQMIEQTMGYEALNQLRQDEAMDKFMGIMAGLVKNGRIQKPAAPAALIGADKIALGKDEKESGDSGL